ncbi:MAG TPA: hypothetical protein PLU52_11055 [Opitutaceae bacterium]|nr:hypothetical protein [Opitutaceae bacterium]
MNADDETHADRTPWSRRHGFEDTTRRRVEVRMVFLGLTQRMLGALFDPPIDQRQVQQYLVGNRPWRRQAARGEHAIERFARILGVPVEALEPGGPWEALVRPPSDSA